jgi:mRNA interferase RelE/StbE
MRQLGLDPDAGKFLKAIDRKHSKQISSRLVQLMDNPKPHDSRHLSGAVGYFYLTEGEYRVIYTFGPSLVSVQMVDRRNDDRVYRRFNQR